MSSVASLHSGQAGGWGGARRGGWPPGGPSASQPALDPAPAPHLAHTARRPPRAQVFYVIRDYTVKGKKEGAEEARAEIPFLFKAFETGQIGPRRLARMGPHERPRYTTIHEYLDWTVTGAKAEEEGAYVGGARTGACGGQGRRGGVGREAARRPRPPARRGCGQHAATHSAMPSQVPL